MRLSDSPTAKRMRALRRRRRFGLRAVKVELSTIEINKLVEKSYLKPDHSEDLSAIEQALYDFIADHLMPA
jgi:hypothetical protein